MPKLDRKELPHNSKVTTHECLYCAITFYASKPFAKYCSDKCRVYFNQKKKIEREMREAKAQEELAKQTVEVVSQEKPFEEPKAQEDHYALVSATTNTTKAPKQNKKGPNQLEIEW